MRYIFSSLLLLVAFNGASFEAPSFANKQFQIESSDNTPVIDGIFHQDEWQDAVIIEDLVERTPVIGRTPEYSTKIFAKYDSQYMYFVAIMEQKSTSTVANQLVQGKNAWQDDYFAVEIDPTNGKTDAYYFHVTPNSIREDGLVENREYIEEWQGIWQARASINEDHWVAEIAIPIQTLSFDQDISNWGIQFRRRITDPSRQYFWNLNDTEGWGWYANQSGTMQGVSDLDTGLGLEVKPSLALKEHNFIEHPDNFKHFQPSLDMFYKLTPSLTTALTFNTDFSGTDVDEQQVNLGRFSLFLPEKRDFFLQDAGIFEFGGLRSNGRPFFSRTIGLSSQGSPLDIDAGIKLTGKMGKFNVGLLTVQQDAENSADGSAYVSVARSRYAINDKGYIGAIVTSGNPSINKQDTLVGFDVRQGYTLDNGLLVEANAWWQSVDNHGQESNNNSAYGINIMLPNDKYWAKVNYMVIEENFNPALGFVNRNNIKQFSSEFLYRNRLNNDWVNSIQSRLIYDYTTDTHGVKLSERKKVRPFEFSFANNDYANMAYIDRFERVESTFSLAGEVDILPGDYNFARYSIFYESNNSKPISTYLWYEIGDYFNGERDDYKIGFRLKPNKHIYLNGEYTINKMNFDGYKFDTETIRLNINLAVNAFWAWTNNIQYDNVSDNAGLFSRIKYEPQAGEVYQLVLSRAYDVEDNLSRFHTQSQEVSLKAVYSLRF
ncbi:DUF5916 domain-containing protein [Colwelliaceae bacterium 6441]